MSSDESGSPVDSRPARRGRPKSVGLGERRRAELTEAAYEVFSEFGYDEASVSDIAKRAGMGQGTLYRYVEGKRELLDLVVDLCIDRLMGAIAVDELYDAVRGSDPAVAGRIFRDVGDRLYRLVDDDPRLLKILTAQVSAVDREFRYRVTGLYNTIDGAITRLIGDVSERGWLTIGEDKAPVLARIVPSMGTPGLLLVLTGDRDTPARRASYLDTAVRIERQGLLKRPAGPEPRT
ncbi:TetR/AcrR family transcriptional regulator [Gordonia malaquae]|jgi:AcrR family transcriptional regulator|uniref:TetR/AcrR family transcriptional regulator n=1 Tax=Gordonia malaquae TaxID=410332 RepID=UPI00301A1218